MVDAMGLYDYLTEQLLDAHTPALTDRDEKEIDDRLTDSYDIGGLALRTCQCGKRVDGFYEYIDHLKVLLLEAQP